MKLRAPNWLKNAFRSQPLQWFFFIAAFVVLIVIGVRYWYKRQEKLDQVDLDKLPGNKDVLENITREEADDIVNQCKRYFDTLSLVPGTTIIKINLIKRMLTLTDYELGLINNLYNNRFAIDDDNLYTEIENDWWGTEYEWRDAILNRLRQIRAKAQ